MLSAYALHRIYLNVLRRWGPVLVDEVAGWRFRQLHKCTFGVAFYLGLFYVIIAIAMWGLQVPIWGSHGDVWNWEDEDDVPFAFIYLLVFISGWSIGYYQWKTGVAILGIKDAVKDYAKKVRMGRGPGGGVEMTSVGGRGMAYE